MDAIHIAKECCQREVLWTEFICTRMRAASLQSDSHGCCGTPVNTGPSWIGVSHLLGAPLTILDQISAPFRHSFGVSVHTYSEISEESICSAVCRKLRLNPRHL